MLGSKTCVPVTSCTCALGGGPTRFTRAAAIISGDIGNVPSSGLPEISGVEAIAARGNGVVD
jgi:hypothetical protein